MASPKRRYPNTGRRDRLCTRWRMYVGVHWKISSAPFLRSRKKEDSIKIINESAKSMPECEQLSPKQSVSSACSNFCWRVAWRGEVEGVLLRSRSLRDWHMHGWYYVRDNIIIRLWLTVWIDVSAGALFCSDDRWALARCFTSSIASNQNDASTSLENWREIENWRDLMWTRSPSSQIFILDSVRSRLPVG